MSYEAVVKRVSNGADRYLHTPPLKGEQSERVGGAEQLLHTYCDVTGVFYVAAGRGGRYTISVMNDEDEKPKRSELAESVERLREATIGAAERRERLPQPLFWSLFRSEVERIKRRKAKVRAVSQALGIGEE